ncbi:MAG: hypothetical protein CME71_03315 [Halobacteriovorax sp.]|nr:hypothetical protein [Halobacteriovorax sp.]
MKALSLFLIAIFGLSPAYGASCPEKTPKQWAEYFIQRSENLASSLRPLEEIWEDCGATFELNGVKACAERVLKSARQTQYTRYNGHSMGWEVSDTDYISSVPDGYLDLPREFKDGLPANYQELAREKGWKMVEYRSRTVPNPPYGSFSRVLFLIEGEKVDKWIQFTLPEDPNNKERLIDFIALEKPEGPNDKATPYFTQYWRDGNSRNPKMRTSGSFDNCYSCHPNGMRELSPEPGSYSAEGAQNLDYMREAMTNYTAGRGSVDWGGALHPEEYGPPMGQAQGCVKCHNNGDGMHEFSRGAITGRHDRGHIRHKMTEDKTMPVSMLPMEKSFLDFMDNIPNVLTEAERQQFSRAMLPYKRNQGAMYDAAVKWMSENGKITDEEKQRYSFILNGHPNYPACEDQPDCYKGLKRFNKYYEEMMEQYPDQLKAWRTEHCQDLLTEEQDHSVNDSGRATEGFIERATDFIDGVINGGSER